MNDEPRQPLSEVGKFRGEIVDYELKEFDSGSVLVKLFIEVTEKLVDKNWQVEPSKEFVGDVWVVGRKGLQKNACQNLMEHAGWSGSFQAITNREWHPTPIGFETEMNQQYGLQLRYINSYESQGNSSTVSGKSLDEKLGGQVRSIKANAKFAEAPSKPFAKLQPQAQQAPAATPDEQIPF